MLAWQVQAFFSYGWDLCLLAPPLSRRPFSDFCPLLWRCGVGSGLSTFAPKLHRRRILPLIGVFVLDFTRSYIHDELGALIRIAWSFGSACHASSMTFGGDRRQARSGGPDFKLRHYHQSIRRPAPADRVGPRAGSRPRAFDPRRRAGGRRYPYGGSYFTRVARNSGSADHDSNLPPDIDRIARRPDHLSGSGADRRARDAFATSGTGWALRHARAPPTPGRGNRTHGLSLSIRANSRNSGLFFHVET